MKFQEVVTFSGEPPSLDQIFNDLRETTGLNIELQGWRFFYEEDSIKLCEVIVLMYPEEKKKIYVTSWTKKDSYLKCTLISVLVNLGGYYKGRLPSWAGIEYSNKKWWHRIRC